MDTDHNKGNDGFKMPEDWKLLSKQLKEKFSLLTDSDLRFEVGKEGDLLSRMGYKLSKNREQVMDIIKKTNLS
ncbi:hypothetical protein M2347_003211 [Chryseobacterium sp. H1D6B]|uniref:hypothetical protein n=1 Tax=Chryseobacterium sp. H1D6B TaxID=2940588 RepID=UPI0015CAC228|nr:hypothetical protein [Chryseobacterium sp. H1D6B]MDH6253484.1 hypothetical protein [Chryseobacterium sp. H1D6B]